MMIGTMSTDLTAKCFCRVRPCFPVKRSIADHYIPDFDKSRVYRPRLLIQGAQGMGQQYLGGAILHKFERLHVQSFDLSILYSDTARVS